MEFWGSISGEVEWGIHLVGLVGYIYEVRNQGLVAEICPSVGGHMPSHQCGCCDAMGQG